MTEHLTGLSLGTAGCCEVAWPAKHWCRREASLEQVTNCSLRAQLPGTTGGGAGTASGFLYLPSTKLTAWQKKGPGLCCNTILTIGSTNGQ